MNMLMYHLQIFMLSLSHSAMSLYHTPQFKKSDIILINLYNYFNIPGKGRGASIFALSHALNHKQTCFSPLQTACCSLTSAEVSSVLSYFQFLIFSSENCCICLLTAPVLLCAGLTEHLIHTDSVLPQSSWSSKVVLNFKKHMHSIIT